MAGSWEDALQDKWRREAERILNLRKQAEIEGKPYLLELAKIDAQRLIEQKRELEEKIAKCAPFKVRDIVSFGGTEKVLLSKRNAVITQVYPPANGYFGYGIKMLREDELGLKPGSAALDGQSINEGPCRPDDIRVWTGPMIATAMPRGRRKKGEKVAGGLLGVPEEFEETIAETMGETEGVITTPISAVKVAPAVAASKDDFLMFRDIVDGLLGELPQKKVEKFVGTPEYKIYTKVMENGEPEGVQKKFVEIVDDLLGDLPKKTVEKFVGSTEFQVYERIIKKFKPE